MRCELFSVFDVVSERFLEPFYAPTVEYALRQFRTTVNTPDHQFNRYPEDYSLFHVGGFDQKSGCIEAFSTPRSLGVGVTFVAHSRTTNGEVRYEVTDEGRAALEASDA